MRTAMGLKFGVAGTLLSNIANKVETTILETIMTMNFGLHTSLLCGLHDGEYVLVYHFRAF
jgi:hypothetical protein